MNWDAPVPKFASIEWIHLKLGDTVIGYSEHPQTIDCPFEHSPSHDGSRCYQNPSRPTQLRGTPKYNLLAYVSH
jgi:hypothetical protein